MQDLRSIAPDTNQMRKPPGFSCHPPISTTNERATSFQSDMQEKHPCWISPIALQHEREMQQRKGKNELFYEGDNDCLSLSFRQIILVVTSHLLKTVEKKAKKLCKFFVRVVSWCGHCHYTFALHQSMVQHSTVRGRSGWHWSKARNRELPTCLHMMWKPCEQQVVWCRGSLGIHHRATSTEQNNG